MVDDVLHLQSKRKPLKLCVVKPKKRKMYGVKFQNYFCGKMRLLGEATLRWEIWGLTNKMAQMEYNLYTIATLSSVIRTAVVPCDRLSQIRSQMGQQYMSSATATRDQFYKAKTKYFLLEITLNDRTSLQCGKHCLINDPVGAVLYHITLYAPERHRTAKSNTEPRFPSLSRVRCTENEVTGFTWSLSSWFVCLSDKWRNSWVIRKQWSIR